MADLKVECCRCRNQHLESERVPKPSKDIPGTKVLTCPRCGAHDYYVVEKKDE